MPGPFQDSRRCYFIYYEPALEVCLSEAMMWLLKKVFLDKSRDLKSVITNDLEQALCSLYISISIIIHGKRPVQVSV